MPRGDFTLIRKKVERDKEFENLPVAIKAKDSLTYKTVYLVYGKRYDRSNPDECDLTARIQGKKWQRISLKEVNGNAAESQG